MATGGTPFDENGEDLHNWTVTNGSLEDRLNNMDWGVQQKKANRSSEKNKKKLSAVVVESRLTNDISPESTPGAGRRRARTPHSFPHIKYTTQMSVPDQAELDKLRQRINFTDLDERSIGSDSQGRVTAANNQRQLAGENKKPYNFLPLHVNTNKSKELLPPSSSAPATPAITKETKKQSPGLRDMLTPVAPSKETPKLSRGGSERGPLVQREYGRGDPRLDSSQVVSKLVQIREYISKASSMRDDLVEKNDVPANVERLSHLIDHLKEQEKSYLRFLQKMLARENEEDDEELENLRKQHELLKKMLEQQEQLRALQGRQEALMAMQHSAEQALAVIEDTETTGSVSGLSITSELNDELNDLIQRFHNQLHDSQTKAVPDNRRQAESLSLSREVGWSRASQAVGPPHAKLTKLQELHDKKQTMDKILQELHSLRDQTLNNNSCKSVSQGCLLLSVAFFLIISNSTDKLRKLKEVHKRLNELRELVQYYEQTSDMMVDAVNENDSSMFETMFDSEQENRQPVTNIRNPQRGGNWTDLNSLTNGRSGRSTTNNRDGRLNTECEINNRSAANLRSLNIPSCQYNRDTPYKQVKDEDEDEDCLDNEEGAQAVAADSEASGSSRRSSLGNDRGFAQKGHRQTAKQKLRQLQELVAMVQVRQISEYLDTIVLMFKIISPCVEKLYEEKLLQQKQELKQLHEERQRLIEIQGKIQDLQWACPDLQVFYTHGLVTPIKCQGTKRFEAATSSVTDNELWSEMRRHQILREELRQRRKHLESLMAEHQRRSGLNDSPCRTDDQDGLATPSQPVSRDERTMATWGSTSGHLDDDDDEEEEEEEEYHSEMGAEEEQEECAESSSDDDIHIYPSSRNQCSYTSRNNQGSGYLHNKTKAKQQQQQILNQSASQHGRTRRQENLRWASELSFAEGSCHWQEQISQLQRQLDFSTSMCQTLLQDQQTLSYMLQTLLTGQYSMLPNNLSSPQVHLVMHQLNQCYTQLAWQQNNVQRLKQVLNDLLQQQQQQQQQQPLSSTTGWQTQKQSLSQESSSGPSASPGVFLPFSSTLHPSANNLSPAALSPFPPGFNLYPLFPAAMGEFSQGAASQATPDHQKQQLDPNTSIKTEYMGFPPPLQRSPLNTTTERRYVHYGCLKIHFVSPSSSPAFTSRHSRPQDFDQASQESFSSMPGPVDSTTITKTFKAGHKASAQANLASRSKTSNSKSRRRRSKGHSKNSEGIKMESTLSTECFNITRFFKVFLLDRLTQEKLDSKTKLGNKRNDLSSDASSDFSLFEALRETIYSEVATLISQNESRPHFLIELFHELQLLNTDYLRQRALYSLQVSRETLDHFFVDVQLLFESSVLESFMLDSDYKISRLIHPLIPLNRALDNDSTMSTSSNLEPFANDDLGNTVIHLDKALARIREYERMKLKAEFNPCNTSAGAGGSEVSNAQHSSANAAEPIDTQQLDRQIKAIMTEVIPFLKENMDEVCSLQLLTSVRRMVLALTQQNDESKEFVRFFHRQLGGILQDSLSKFLGRTLKDCGEDLLVEISEILFNELAFFRLMQDLDNSSSSIAFATKHKNRKKAEHPSKPKHSLKDQDEAEQEDNPTLQELYLQTETNNNRSSEASEVEDDDDGDGQGVPLSISLSKAETQPLTNYGSGEDENEDEEIEEFDAGPVEVQTSLQASADGQMEHEVRFTEINQSVGTLDSTVEEQNTVWCQSPEEESKPGAAAEEEEENSTVCQDVPKESTTTSSPDTDSPVMINVDEVGSGNTSQRSDEEDFVRVDDLPLQLTVMCEEELQKRIVEEQQNNNLSVEILSGNSESLTGLVGNAQALKEPDTAAAQSM
uniref:Pericentriolar material 1 n=1 Tax=Mastacembelus armatus TaxID=205130 RepID=A0A7N9B0H2_9TELE